MSRPSSPTSMRSPSPTSGGAGGGNANLRKELSTARIKMSELMQEKEFAQQNVEKIKKVLVKERGDLRTGQFDLFPCSHSCAIVSSILRCLLLTGGGRGAQCSTMPNKRSSEPTQRRSVVDECSEHKAVCCEALAAILDPSGTKSVSRALSVHRSTLPSVGSNLVCRLPWRRNWSPVRRLSRRCVAAAELSHRLKQRGIHSFQ